MTINEQIAKVMGWEISEHEYFILNEGDDALEYNALCISKIMQRRIVADGWRIVITAYTTGMFEALAVRLTAHNGISGNQVENYHMSDTVASERAAIVSLFKKVYGIEV